jgi:hypothetical protein
MFAFLSARDAAERMTLLERFLVFWYGAARPEHGFAETQLNTMALPVPLHQFYRFAGRRPTPNLRPYLQSFEFEAEGYFYTGTAGHHLYDPGTLVWTANGRLRFFEEHSGNWQLLTLPTGDDPLVWQQEEGRTTLLSVTLSELLVTHCLMTTLYEEPNTAWSSPFHLPMARLVTRFEASLHETELLWIAEYPQIDYSGAFLLWRGNILVHRRHSAYHFTAIHPSGTDFLRDLAS